MSNTTEEDLTTSHGVTVQARWGWTSDVSTGRWSRPQQVIKPMRFHIPSNSESPNDDGFPVRYSKLKIRGQGRALTLRFESQDGKDFHIMGFSVPITAESE